MILFMHHNYLCNQIAYIQYWSYHITYVPYYPCTLLYNSIAIPIYQIPTSIAIPYYSCTILYTSIPIPIFQNHHLL